MTRVFSFMMAAEVSGLTYNQIGVSDAFHPLSHHNNEQAKMDKLVKIQTYHTDIFAKFLAKLAEDAGWRRHHAGSLADSVRQQHEQQQCAQSRSAADGAGGRLETVKGGQHLKYPDQTPLANMLLTILDRAGVPEEKFGDSSGKFTEV